MEHIKAQTVPKLAACVCPLSMKALLRHACSSGTLPKARCEGGSPPALESKSPVTEGTRQETNDRRQAGSSASLESTASSIPEGEARQGGTGGIRTVPISASHSRGGSSEHGDSNAVLTMRSSTAEFSAGGADGLGSGDMAGTSQQTVANEGHSAGDMAAVESAGDAGACFTLRKYSISTSNNCIAAGVCEALLI